MTRHITDAKAASKDWKDPHPEGIADHVVMETSSRLTKDEIERIAAEAWDRQARRSLDWIALDADYKRRMFDVANDIVQRGGANSAYEHLVAAVKAEYITDKSTVTEEKVAKARAKAKPLLPKVQSAAEIRKVLKKK